MSRAAFSPSSNACRSTAPLSWYSSSAIQVESFVVCSLVQLAAQFGQWPSLADTTAIQAGAIEESTTLRGA